MADNRKPAKAASSVEFPTSPRHVFLRVGALIVALLAVIFYLLQENNSADEAEQINRERAEDVIDSLSRGR